MRFRTCRFHRRKDVPLSQRQGRDRKQQDRRHAGTHQTGGRFRLRLSSGWPDGLSVGPTEAQSPQSRPPTGVVWRIRKRGPIASVRHTSARITTLPICSGHIDVTSTDAWHSLRPFRAMVRQFRNGSKVASGGPPASDGVSAPAAPRAPAVADAVASQTGPGFLLSVARPVSPGEEPIIRWQLLHPFLGLVYRHGNPPACGPGVMRCLLPGFLLHGR
jgi:hypothetical protein